jgi:hypothetical protein
MKTKPFVTLQEKFSTIIIILVVLIAITFGYWASRKFKNQYSDHTIYMVYSDSAQIAAYNQKTCYRVALTTYSENGLTFQIRPYYFKYTVVDYAKKKTIALAICPYCLPVVRTVGITIKSAYGGLCPVYCLGCGGKFYPNAFPDGNYYCRSKYSIPK